MGTELENVKAENRDLIYDVRILNKRLDLAHSEGHKLAKRCEDLERQLRDSKRLLKIARR